MLYQNVQFIKGIGPKKAAALQEELGIETVEDLLYFSPRKYLDRTDFRKISDVFVNETVTLGGNIVAVDIAGRNRKYLEVIIDDGTDSISGIFFHSINYFAKIFTPGEYVLFSGRVEFYKNKQIVHPDFDFIDEDSQINTINTARIIPLYRSTEKLKKLGLDSRGFRRIIRSLIDIAGASIKDPLKDEILTGLGMMPLKEALFSIHFPDTLEKAESARRRLAFNELFFLQYYLSVSKKYDREELHSEKNKIDDTLYNEFIKNIPFDLTGDQKSCILEIKADMEKPYPMNRMLQGDVGSGKTIVSIAASLFAMGRGEQTAFMAPTEVLATQHYDTFTKFIPGNINVALLKGSTTAAEKKESIRRYQTEQ